MMKQRKIEDLTETEIRTQYVLPALLASGWDHGSQIYEEFAIKAGQIDVRGTLTTRRSSKHADVVLANTQGVPIAIIEIKDANKPVGSGMGQAVDYAELLGGVPYVFSTNGRAFRFQDRTGSSVTEVELGMDQFPSPDELVAGWRLETGLSGDELELVETPFYLQGQRLPRYYQLTAVNKTIEAIANGKERLLLVMATGTGKTFTAFQIIWRLMKAKRCQRVLFLADRDVLINQAQRKDFEPFGQKLTRIEGHKIDTSYEVYLSLYQAIDGDSESNKAYKEFSPDFFDLVVVDECHRGSASEDSAWREILEYFDSAVQIGLTATPKETKSDSNIEYFGEPVYTYTLKQGIEDGYLAPYKVVRIDLDKDLDGYRPPDGKIDDHGVPIEDRHYDVSDFDRNLILEQRTDIVAAKITEYLEETDPYAKTIVFCMDQEHADRMRAALVNLNGERVKENADYVVRITADEGSVGRGLLERFQDPEDPYPVIVTTSEMLSTGVDVETCKLIVIDQTIKSMTKFKQIIGRGTRIKEEYNKFFFTIMDFRRVTTHFADPDFDGEPTSIYEPGDDDSPVPPDDLEGDDDFGDPDDDLVHDPPADEDEGEGGTKYRVGDVPVTVVGRTVKYFGPNGDLVTESVQDYARARVTENFATLDDFLRYWHEGERKQAVIDELAERGVFFEALSEAVGKDLSAFDLICHVAYDQPPLTRKQRADGVVKSGYFKEYSEVAQQVLTALLDKYADEGVEPDAGPNILKVPPFEEMGTVMEILDEFGGRDQFDDAVRGLEDALYEMASI